METREEKKKRIWARLQEIKRKKVKFSEERFEEKELAPYDDREADYEFDGDK